VDAISEAVRIRPDEAHMDASIPVSFDVAGNESVRFGTTPELMDPPWGF
jgi:hypothetical protein